MTRRAAARDLNELEIVQALERVGCKIVRLAEVDLLVLRAGSVFLVEVKNPKGRNRLTPFQEELLSDKWPLHVVRTPEEALRAVGL